MNRPGTLFPLGAETRAVLRRAGVLTGIGAVALLPALILVVSGFAGLRAPEALVHPVLVLGGLAVAFGASFVAATHWELSSDQIFYRVECSIRKNRPADLLILGASVTLLGIILVYSFLENFQPR